MAAAVLPSFGSDMTPEWGPHSVHHLSPSPSSSSSPPPSSSSFISRPPPSSSSMAATASSSRPVGPRPAQRARKNDVFKPRFPFDPFTGAPAAALGEPWFLKVDALLAATSYQRRNVIFVLGAPSLKELAPLLQSRHLAKSLVILATHNPPEIPHIVLPTVRILHLSAPLALQDAGAVRFVNVLEWAERIARAWRKHGGTGVLELSEELDIDAELAPPSVLRFNGSQSTPASPGSSSTQLSSESLPSRPSSIFRPHSSSSGNFLSRGRQASQSLPKPDPSQRPFDALINFLPSSVSDKALLKTSILVTTISRPFLVSNGPAPPPMRERTSSSSSMRLRRPQSIFNAFSRSSTSVYLPPTPPYQSGESLSLLSLAPPPPAKALLIHLLPPPPTNAPVGARRKLVESIESFLVSFAFQAVPPGSLGHETLERARPYLMEAGTFCDSVGCEPGVADWGDWTVADVVLSGSLDAETAPSGSAGMSGGAGMNAGVGTPGSAGKGKMVGSIAKGKTSRRAWIATAADLVILPGGGSSGSSADESYPGSAAVSPDSIMTLGQAQTQRFSNGRPDSYFAAVNQQQQQAQSLPRTFEKGKRSSSAPLLSSDWAPNSNRPHSHPQMANGSGHLQHPPQAHLHAQGQAHHRSFSSGLSKQLPPTPPLPTPPHSSEESDDGASGSGSAVGSSLSGSGKSAGEKKEGSGSKWKFWRRLSHVPAATKA
ncbi:hypothetical protein PYCCODRAFT_1524386 [Trametes coccinea BRFM310]|uniref:Uncharacterized protein n=1 Tax=Trametes coccinea (strain BRFM310) TaxID=1353009 RepID=A0A1Y2IAB5_TRAC3|nr:hypothetical protein PYCCODRAFT_1524386 [Trametes coccinea BRFM310]